jgi:hypothetical protein
VLSLFEFASEFALHLLQLFGGSDGHGALRIVMAAIILREPPKIKIQLNARQWKIVNPVENVGKLLRTVLLVFIRFCGLYDLSSSTLWRNLMKIVDTKGVNR